MKFTITRERLHDGLSAVAPSVPAKTTLPVLSNILVEATKDGLRFSGTRQLPSDSKSVVAIFDPGGA